MNSRVTAWWHRQLPPGSVRGRLGTGTAWSFAGTVFSNVFGLATGVATARLLGQVGYGELGVIMSTYALFAQLGGLGLGVTATKHLAEYRASDRAEAGRIAGASLTTALISYVGAATILALFAEPLATTALNAPALTGILRFSSLYLALAGINGVQVGVLAGFEAFRATARLNVGRAIMNLPLTVAGAWWFGLWGVVGAMVLVALVMVVAFHVEVTRLARRERVQLRYEIDKNHLAILWRFSLPAFLAGSLVVPATWVVNALLVNQRNGYQEMGLLNAANQWRALAILVPNVANRVVLAVQSNLYAEADRVRFHRALVANLMILTALSGVVAVGLVIAAPWIMKAYGEGFSAGVSVVTLLAASWFLLAPTWVLWNAMVSSNQVWQGLFFNAVGAAILLAGAWAWRDRGALGISGAYVLSAAVQVLIQGAYYIWWRRSEVP